MLRSHKRSCAILFREDKVLEKTYIDGNIDENHIRESQLIIDHFGLDGAVEVKDVLKSSGSYPCLFTCPPYGIKERWNEKNDLIEKSCDEWIQECMQRFDCERYLFVVDGTGCFKDNIVEEIDNSSHLGRGKEYVVLIKKKNEHTLKYALTLLACFPDP